MNIKIFFCEPSGNVRRSLRRYANGPCVGGQYSYHDASVMLDETQDKKSASGDLWPHDDPRWPKKCAHCGYQFKDDDNWQLFHDALYRRIDTGEILPWKEMPVGAVRELTWLHDRDEWVGPDGRSLACKTPGGEWYIDSRAKNCTLPDDKVHKCWVRHGKPEDGTLHVDKNGVTCAAGAGSIMAGNYHGFLHHGHLTEC